MSPRARVGVDTGGTFTDCVAVDLETGTLRVAKVPSRPGEPQRAVMEGVEVALGGRESGASCESVVHGTTVATNAVIEGDLARAALITTTGFRDALEVGTQQRPLLYSLHQRPLPSLIERDLRFEVAGRLDASGAEVEPVDEDEVARIAARLAAQGVEAVAVACPFSFVDDRHERLIASIVAEHAPGIHIGRSAAISPEPREYPRFATAATNVALAPKLDPYISALGTEVARLEGAARLFVMQSNGGIATAERAVGEAAHGLILSGPAAGVIGAERAAVEAGFGGCVSFDVGGTSADIGIVQAGGPRTGIDLELPNGVPIKAAHIEVVTIGAGGGSIARVDAGGALTVGPASAGADPGPACYGRGGTEPTVTDANLVLGRLSPHGLIGGELPLDVELARRAFEPIATALRIGIEHAALGVLAVLEENMAGATRRAAARHGDDLRELALVAAGGGGPLSAASLARRLGMRAVIVPPYPGLLSAAGLLGSDVRHDLSAPWLSLLEAVDPGALGSGFDELEDAAREAVSADGLDPNTARFERSIDVRYLGQEYSLGVGIDADEPLSVVERRFHERHETNFGHSTPGAALELTALRLVARVPRAVSISAPSDERRMGESGTRRVIFDPTAQPIETVVVDRATLGVGDSLAGPAIITQLDTTTLVWPGSTLSVVESGSLVIEEAT